MACDDIRAIFIRSSLPRNGYFEGLMHVHLVILLVIQMYYIVVGPQKLTESIIRIQKLLTDVKTDDSINREVLCVALNVVLLINSNLLR